MYAGTDKYGGAVVGEGQPDGTHPNAPMGLSLEETIETAAAEETVVVDVPYSYYEDEENPESLVTGTTQVLLSAQLNPDAGGLMWVEQENPQNAYKNVVAMSQMTSMLRDVDRNKCYELGIKHAIATFIEKHQRAPIVLDIGTGTGLLAMLAALHGAAHVYACEMFAPMADIAKNVTAANHPDKITVLPLRSTDLIVSTEDNPNGHLPQRADMLVSELFDSLLLGEAVLPTIRHAKEHLLVPDAVIIPERATVYAQIVENEKIYRLNSLEGQYLNDQRALLARDSAAWECTGAKPALPVHIGAYEATSKMLTVSTPVLSFDFTQPNNKQSYEETTVEAIADGDVHAVVMWWEVIFTEDNSIVYSTKPEAQNWQDHWVQVVFPLTNRIQAHTSDALVLRAHHDDLRIWFDVEKHEDTEAIASLSPSKKLKRTVETEKLPCTCGLHLVCNAERIAMLSDSTRNAAFSAAITKSIETLQKTTSGALSCLDVSDGSLCALLAATQGMTNVTSIESKDVSARIFQQILDGNNVDVEVLCSGCKGLLPEHMKGEQKIDLLVGEPFYYSMQNLPLWQAFNFWLRRSAVADLLHAHALTVPTRARVCALAVQFEHLHECFGAVGNVSGFDHSYFDQFQDEYYTRNFPFPVYMYPYTAVSEVLELARLDYKELAESLFSDFTTELKEPPNAVIVWVEYTLDAEGKYSVATGPSVGHSKQLIRFLPLPSSPSDVTNSILHSRFQFNALEGTITLDFDVEHC